ncbi:hypothetical protein ABXT54_07130 [Methylophilaceae bacterium Uisw_099_01]
MINISTERILYLSLLFIVLMSSKAIAQPTLIISGVLEDENGLIEVSKEVKSGDTKIKIDDYYNYELTADISLKLQKQKTLFEELQFKINNSLDDIQMQKKLFFNTNYSNELNNVKINFLPDLQILQDNNHNQNRVKLLNYNELWIDYQDVLNANPTQFNLLLELETGLNSKSISNKLYYVIKSDSQDDMWIEPKLRTLFKRAKKENISNATWQLKNYIYLFKRAFGLEGTNHWHYVQNEKNVLLQRRFDRALSSDEAFDLVFDTDNEFEFLNLRLDTKDGEVIVNWDSLPKAFITDDDGSLRVRVFLNQLERQYSEGVLKEMIIFLPGNVDEILKNRPSLSIQWLDITYLGKNKDQISEESQPDQKLREKINSKETPDAFVVKSRIIDFGISSKRLILDFAKVLREIDMNANVTSLTMSLNPTLTDQPGGIELSTVRLVSNHEYFEPSINLMVRELMKLWGVSLDPVANYSESNLWPVLMKYKILEQGITPTNIDPQNRWVDYKWEVGKEIAEGSYLYIGGKDAEDKEVNIQVTPYTSIGKSVGDWFLKLNESVQLNNLKGNGNRIDYIKIRVYLDPSSDIGKSSEKDDIQILKGSQELITELALFKIDSLSYSEMLDVSFPFKKETYLDLEIESKPSNIIINQTQDGASVINILDNKPLDSDLLFKTVINDQNSSGDKSLVVSYEVPFYFNIANKCWLEMTSIGSGKSIRKELCLDVASGEKSIPLPDWVNQVKWRFKLPNVKNNLNKETFSLSLKLVNTASSIKNQLISKPILKFDNKYLMPVDSTFNKYKGNLYFDLNAINHNNFFEDIKFVTHPLLKVDKINLKRWEPFSSQQWQEINKGEVLLVNWIQLLKYLFIIIALWWFIANGWFIRSFQALVALFLLLWNFPTRTLRRFNIEVGCKVALCFWSTVALSLYAWGILYEGNYYFTFAGMAVVMSWRSLLEVCKPNFESRWPALSKRIYCGAGTKYFFGFIGFLFVTIVLLVLRLELIADRLAVIGYYMLVVGLALEIKALKKNKLKINQKNSIDK